MIRLIESIKSPITAISGPWGHVYPNLGGPGPKIGFLKLALDWWDTWLKEDENDSMRENKFLAYIQTSHEPDQQARDRPGFWIKENKCGRWRMHAVTGSYNDKMIKDFKNGWIPQEDNEWKTWRKDNTLK